MIARAKEAIVKHLERIEQRSNRAAGPVPLPDDVELFQVAARADVPSLCRAIRAVIQDTECPCCGGEHPDMVMKIVKQLRIKPQDLE
jgi:hypothetical protein